MHEPFHSVDSNCGAAGVVEDGEQVGLGLGLGLGIFRVYGLGFRVALSNPSFEISIETHRRIKM